MSQEDYEYYLGDICDDTPEKRRQKRHIFMSDDGMYLYYVGIIDYLQDFNLNKKGENFLKGFIDDPNEISAVPSKQYAKRFYRFMQNTVIKNQVVQDYSGEKFLDDQQEYLEERRKSTDKKKEEKKERTQLYDDDGF